MTSFPKPEPIARQKARADRAYAKARARCVLTVFMRERARCETCKRIVRHKDDPRVTEFNIGHVHEDPPRSLGGDPLDPNQCHLHCNKCHSVAHGLRVSP